MPHIGSLIHKYARSSPYAARTSTQTSATISVYDDVEVGLTDPSKEPRAIVRTSDRQGSFVSQIGLQKKKSWPVPGSVLESPSSPSRSTFVGNNTPPAPQPLNNASGLLAKESDGEEEEEVVVAGPGYASLHLAQENCAGEATERGNQVPATNANNSKEEPEKVPEEVRAQ